MTSINNIPYMKAPKVIVAHRLPGRLRFIVPGLQGSRPLASGIVRMLSTIAGVYQAEANPLTGRALVFFNPRQVNEGALRQGIFQVIAGHRSSTRPCFKEQEKPKNLRTDQGKGLQEPEDLPISKQLFNVALGGGVLAYLGLKHLLVGRTPLARHPHIFNLAAITAIVGGYPVLRSGLQELARGRINYDLVMGTLALGTILVRESIPGLLVIWLTNFAALLQSLALKGYLNALPARPEGRPLQREDTETPEWSEAAREYGRKAVLPVLGLASLSGLAGGPGGFQRALAMLLAANPSPAGLAAPTAATAIMARAGKNGILYRDVRTLEAVSNVDTVVLKGIEALREVSFKLGDILPMPGISKTRLLNAASLACNISDDPYGQMLQRALSNRRQRFDLSEYEQDKTLQVLAGDEKTLGAAGVDVKWGFYKARRLRHLKQIPVFVSLNGRLAGLIGIKQNNPGDLLGLVNDLRAVGICKIIATVEQDSIDSFRSANAIEVWANLPDEEVAERIRGLKARGHKVAVALGNTCDGPVLKEAHVCICEGARLNHNQVDIIIPNYLALPEIFRMALRGEQRSRQNITLVQAANAVGLALGASGRLPAMAAKVYNNLISLAVGANSFRLLSDKSRKTKVPAREIRTVELETAATLEYAVNLPENRRMDALKQVRYVNWHNLGASEALQKLKSDLQKGLKSLDAQQRLIVFGPNKMVEEKPQGFAARLWGQMKDFLVKTLMASAVICVLLGELGDALAIIAILALNAVLGAMQEQKAEGALRELGKLTAPTARVKRSGKVERIPAADLVPGDIVLLEQGDGVPADIRILEANYLEIDESALTGESSPVLKSSGPLTGCVPLLDCENLAFMGANVTRGRGAGLVIATGMSTEIGKIAGMIQSQEREPTPLQNRMADVGNAVLKYCLAASALVALAGILRGGSPFRMLLTGVSLAVAAIPEGLPAVVTIALASGVKRMAQKNAVVRNLPAVETLGSATLICTDKTGTLTQNRQLVHSVYTGSGWWQAPPGAHPLEPLAGEGDPRDLTALLTAGVLCNDANLKWAHHRQLKGNRPQWQVEGDPTEGALLLAALGENLNYNDMRQRWQRVRELPFDAGRLRMTVVCRDNDLSHAVFVKGAPEVVLELCSQVRVNGQDIALAPSMRRKILEANERLTGEAMRVLAIACRTVDEQEMDSPEQSLVFLGLTGMFDPPRPQVRQAIAACHRAGIKVVMITGDHPTTALAVAKKVGISGNDSVLTGKDIDRLDELELAAAVKEARVFARVLPVHKLRLVKAFRRHGEILAMIGDGINDAPAVKEGDIGIAMGRSGADVTKQAADIVLADDNFATLLAATEQGRSIYSNIRRSARYLLSTNLGLVMLVFTSVLFGLPLPLLPIQLLFLNVLGDGLPALALGVAPPAKDIMEQPPQPANRNFFDDGLGNQILSRGLATGLIGLRTYRQALSQGDPGRARTVAMAAFAASKLLFALECGERKEGRHNRYLIGSVALSLALLAGAVYLPPGRRVFRTSPLDLRDVFTVLGASCLTYMAEKMIALLLKGEGPKKLDKGPGTTTGKS